MQQLLVINTKRKRSQYTVLPFKSFFVIGMLIVLILLEIFKNGSYLDEALGLTGFVFLALYSKNINRSDFIVFVTLVITVVIGLVSNYVSGLISIKPILVDIVTETKLLFSFFAIKYVLNDYEKQRVIDFFLLISKIFIISAFICSVVSQFVNIGMTYDVRLKFIKCFSFFFKFNFQYTSICMLVIGIIICNSKMSEKEMNRYLVMAIIAVFLAGKSSAIIFAAAFILLNVYLKKFGKINIFIILLLGVAVIIVGKYQINTYLMQENAARHVFYKYAIKTANHYFPLGSGFATYGSDQAAKNYSQLYHLYNFKYYWGMSEDYRAFLSDTFWPMAIAQFGWIGFIFYAVTYGGIFLSFNNENYSPTKQAFLISAFVQFIIHAIGSAILSSSAGLIGFSTLALFLSTKEPERNRRKTKNRVKLKIRF